VQLIARYSAIDFDEAAFAAGAAGVASARQAGQFSVGFNWYPSYFIKYNATFERTTFGDASAAGTDEQALIIRAQVAF
jgi:phosphate-selective porin